MEPEISRRCRVCGASVRSRAGFCPQCGTPINSDETDSALPVEASQPLPIPEERTPEKPATDTVMVSDTAAVVDDTASMQRLANESNVQAEGATAQAENAAATVAAATGDLAATSDGTTTGDGTTTSDSRATDDSRATGAGPTRRHRVKVAALDAVEGKIAPRVEKLRQASTVVLDEAADDPGLRFVLVAGVLFLLSLVLLLLSQILE
jgi:hypothetical protein